MPKSSRPSSTPRKCLPIEHGPAIACVHSIISPCAQLSGAAATISGAPNRLATAWVTLSPSREPRDRDANPQRRLGCRAGLSSAGGESRRYLWGAVGGVEDDAARLSLLIRSDLSWEAHRPLRDPDAFDNE